MTYSSSLAMGRHRYAQRNRNTTVYRKDKRGFGPVTSTVILVVLSCLIGLLYLTQVTRTNAYGYRIDDLKKQSAVLQKEHDELEITSARLQSAERLENSSVTSGMISVAPSEVIRD